MKKAFLCLCLCAIAFAGQAEAADPFTAWLNAWDARDKAYAACAVNDSNIGTVTESCALTYADDIDSPEADELLVLIITDYCIARADRQSGLALGQEAEEAYERGWVHFSAWLEGWNTGAAAMSEFATATTKYLQARDKLTASNVALLNSYGKYAELQDLWNEWNQPTKTLTPVPDPMFP